MDGVETLGEDTNMLSVRQRLGKALLQMNSHLVSTKSGALVQVWMPEDASGSNSVLSAQGLPFAVTGVGDLLALFRCVSCRYRFATSTSKPELMGAVGRVFVSCEPEMSHNVQKYDKQVYLRVTEAQRCRVQSTLVMPIFMSAARTKPVAVFELVQSDADVVFPAIMMWLKNSLQGVRLFTSELDAVLTSVGLRRWPALKSGPFALPNERKSVLYGDEDEYDKMDMASAVIPAAHRADSKVLAMEEAVADSESESRQLDEHRGHTPPGPKVKGLNLASAKAEMGRNKSAFSSTWEASSSMFQGFNSSSKNAIPNGTQSNPNHNSLLHVSLQQLLQPPQPRLSGSPPNLQLLPQSMAGGPPSTSPVQANSLASAVQQLQQQQQQLSQQQNPQASQALLDISSMLASQVQELLGSQAMQSLKQMSEQAGSTPASQLGLQSAVAMLINQTAAANAAAAAAGGGGGGGSNLDRAASVASKASKGRRLRAPVKDIDDDEDDAISSGSESEDEGGRKRGSSSRGKDKDRDTDGDEVFQQIKASLEKLPKSSQPNNRSNGGAGSRLRYEDLQAQFGTGLKEAAANLGICATTLKRACRRVGITRWPRRQIAKFNRALNQMGPALTPVAAAAAAASTNPAAADTLPLAALMSSPLGINFASTLAAQLLVQQQANPAAASNAAALNPAALTALNTLLMSNAAQTAAATTGLGASPAQPIPSAATEAANTQRTSPLSHSPVLSHQETSLNATTSAGSAGGSAGGAAVHQPPRQQNHQTNGGMQSMVMLPQTSMSMADSSNHQHLPFFSHLGVSPGRTTSMPGSAFTPHHHMSTAMTTAHPTGDNATAVDSDALMQRMFGSSGAGLGATLSGLGMSGNTMLMDETGESLQSHLMLSQHDAHHAGHKHPTDTTLPSLSSLMGANNSFEMAQFVQASLPMMGFESGPSFFADLGLNSEDLLGDATLAALVNDQNNHLIHEQSVGVYSGTL